MTVNKLPQDVIDFLVEEKSLTLQEESDVTTGQAMEVWGVSRQTARKKLRELVKEGKMIELEGQLLSGGHGNFFRKI